MISTTTSLSSNTNPSTYGNAVTFTATVTGATSVPLPKSPAAFIAELGG